MNAFLLALLLITVNVVAGEDVNVTTSVVPQAKNFRFEDQPSIQSYGLIRFEDQNLDFDDSQNTINGGQSIRFEADSVFQDNRLQQSYNHNEDNQNLNEGQKIKFDEDKRVKRPNQQKKKRRRRPKRLPNGEQAGYPVQQYPGSPVYPGIPAYPGAQVFGPGPIYPGQRPYQPYPEPLFKPRPSATSAALSAVTEALTSVAVYDDAQCVPRLLCEAAGGGSIPGSGILQSVAGLQPLLTLLSAYNGISSSPLFVFGRAVFLGMTSKANPGTCRYAYPQCPNDPEQLVHYLNNHNGGFFRFFAAPQLNQQQGLEQFYNQLAGQHYGLYQPQPLQPHQLPNQNLQGYGLQQNQNQYYGQYQQQYVPENYQNPNQPNQNQYYGQYQQQYVPENYQNLNQQNQNQYYGQYQNYQNSNLQGYGFQQQFNQNSQRPNPYGNEYGLYGKNYPYQKSLNQSSFDNKIQRRIQNVRTGFVNNVSSKPKRFFPEDSSFNKDVYNNVRLGKILKFPQSNLNSIIAAEGFVFPGIQSNREYPIDNIEAFDNNSFDREVDDFRFVNRNHGGLAGDDDSVNSNSNTNDGVRILYVVRGNGDPNNPEIVRLAPGQTL